MNRNTGNTESVKADKIRLNEFLEKVITCARGIIDIRKKDAKAKVDEIREDMLGKSLQKNLKEIGKENFFGYRYLWNIIMEVVIGRYELGYLNAVAFHIQKVWGSYLGKHVNLAKSTRAVYDKLTPGQKNSLDLISIKREDKIKPSRSNFLNILKFGEEWLNQALLDIEKKEGEEKDDLFKEVESFMLIIEVFKEDLRKCNLVQHDKSAESKDGKEDGKEKPVIEAGSKTETKNKQEKTATNTATNGVSKEPKEDAVIA